MSEKKAVDLPDKVTPLEPGDAVPAAAVTQQGSTFAERARAAKKASSKQVDGDGAENKAVAKKAASKK